jgi:nitrate/TMAO reductase-like tetraheme cytochrome c subunit
VWAAFSTGTVAGLYASAASAAISTLLGGFAARTKKEADFLERCLWAASALAVLAVLVVAALNTALMMAASACMLVVAAVAAFAWATGRDLWHGRAALALFAVGGIALVVTMLPDVAMQLGCGITIPLVLFAASALLRGRCEALSSTAAMLGHISATVLGGLTLYRVYGTPTASAVAWAALPYVALYAGGAFVLRTDAFRTGLAAWASALGVVGLAVYLAEPYNGQNLVIVFMAIGWLSVGFALQKYTNTHWPLPLYLSATLLAAASALLAFLEPTADTWRVFLCSGLVFAFLFLIQRQDVYAYLVTLSLALLAFTWVEASTSHFTRDVFFYPVVAAAFLTAVLLIPQIRHAANRLAALPVFGLFSTWGAAIAVVPLCGAALFLSSAYSLKVTAHPRFCTSCHYMDEYYDSWQHSSHKGVACVECHYEPGLQNEIIGKGEGLIQLIKYVSHSYTNRPHGVVSNESCMRSGCHSDIINDGEALLFNEKIRFRHDKHLNEHPRGKELNCVSCHGQMVQGTHIGVTETTCITCHFYGREEKPVAAGDCLSCHAVLDETVTIGNENFNHPAFLAEKSTVECSHCHSQVTQGQGGVSPVRCRSCHLEDYGPVQDQEAFHKIHVSNKHFECLQCHDEIKHGTRPMDQQMLMSSTDCNSCHGGERHTIQERIYSGTAIADLDPSPDFMYAAGVTCEGCHTNVQYIRVGEMTLTGKASGAKQCADCHGDEGYGEMLTDWQTDIHERVNDLQIQWDELTAKCDAAGPQAADAKALLVKAKTSLTSIILDGSYGAHNYMYITAILDDAESKLDDCRTMTEAWASEPSEEPVS